MTGAAHDDGRATALHASVRVPLAIAAISTAAAHVPVIAPHLEEAPYMGVLFVLLAAACLLLAVTVLYRDVPRAYVAAAAVCGLAVR